MDQLNCYRKIIQGIVAKHAQCQPSHGEIEPIQICDLEYDNYLLIGVRWDRTSRVHNVVFHLRIKEGKSWVEWDGIEQGVTQELLEAGVVKEDIVLGFYRPERRAITGFSVA
jgi:hypothetical protein